MTFDAAAGLTTLQITQTTAGAINELLLLKALATTSPITVGATAGTAKITIGSTPSISTALTPPATGGLTINPGGEVSMTCTSNGGAGYTFGTIGGTATTTTTIAGGTLRLGQVSGTSTGTSMATGMTGALTMTSGAIIVENDTGSFFDRRLQVSGNANITGGTVSTTKVGSIGSLTLLGATNTLNPTSWDQDWAVTLSGNQAPDSNASVVVLELKEKLNLP